MRVRNNNNNNNNKKQVPFKWSRRVIGNSVYLCIYTHTIRWSGGQTFVSFFFTLWSKTHGTTTCLYFLCSFVFFFLMQLNQISLLQIHICLSSKDTQLKRIPRKEKKTNRLMMGFVWMEKSDSKTKLLILKFLHAFKLDCSQCSKQKIRSFYKFNNNTFTLFF